MPIQPGFIQGIKPDQKGPEAIYPSKTSFIDKALVINLLVKIPFPSTLFPFSVPKVLYNVRRHFPSLYGSPKRLAVKAFVGILDAVLQAKATCVELPYHTCVLGNNPLQVIVVPTDDAPIGNGYPFSIGHDQNVRGTPPLAVLVSHTLGRLFYQAMGAVEVQFFRVQFVFLYLQIGMEHFLEHPTSAPFTITVIDRLPRKRRGNTLYINEQKLPLASRFEFMDDALKDIGHVKPALKTPIVFCNKGQNTVFQFVFC